MEKLGNQIVFTNGCFDIIHQGHIEVLSNHGPWRKINCRIKFDKSIKKLKGKNRPIKDEYSRAMLMAFFNFVDAVILFSEDTPIKLTRELKPDILAKGGDYKIEEIVGHKIIKEVGGEVKLIPFVEGYSSTQIIKKINENKWQRKNTICFLLSKLWGAIPKWLGKCPQCGEWNTFVEEIINKDDAKTLGYSSNKNSSPKLVSNIDYSNEKRIITNDKELNRVLGGGIVPGSLILLGGDPGIGKSTLMLQFALSSKNRKILYVSGEESQKQIKMRAERINKDSNHCYILTETSTQNIFQQVEKIEPDILVVDSIQTLHTSHIDSSPGSVSQIRECTAELIKFAKETATAVFLIGHINKDGAIAGPKILEHMADTVLQFEGDRNYVYRI